MLTLLRFIKIYTGVLLGMGCVQFSLLAMQQEGGRPKIVSMCHDTETTVTQAQVDFVEEAIGPYILSRLSVEDIISTNCTTHATINRQLEDQGKYVVVFCQRQSGLQDIACYFFDQDCIPSDNHYQERILINPTRGELERYSPALARALFSTSQLKGYAHNQQPTVTSEVQEPVQRGKKRARDEDVVIQDDTEQDDFAQDFSEQSRTQSFYSPTTTRYQQTRSSFARTTASRRQKISSLRTASLQPSVYVDLVTIHPEALLSLVGLGDNRSLPSCFSSDEESDQDERDQDNHQQSDNESDDERSSTVSSSDNHVSKAQEQSDDSAIRLSPQRLSLSTGE